MEKKRSIGVTILAWYFLLQAWVGLGHIMESGYPIIFIAICVSIGIGLLKLHNIARLAAIYSCAILFVYSLFISISLSRQYSIVRYPESSISGRGIALLLYSLIMLTITVVYLTRPKVKEQFK